MSTSVRSARSLTAFRTRSEEHTSELQSHRDLHSFPTRRSSDLFVQDDWRATRRLTLNFGLRYEYFSPISEVADRVSNADLANGKIILAGQGGVTNTVGVKKDFLNLAPRFGFAALLSKSTVLRGGYGINYMPQSFGTPYALRNPPFSSLLTTTTSPTTPAQTVRKLSEGLPSPTPTDPAN